MAPESPEARLTHIEACLARLQAILSQLTLAQRLTSLEGYFGKC